MSATERHGHDLTCADLLQLLESSIAMGHSYETLMSSIRLRNGADALKTLLFTSTQPAEGKTTVALGLALAMTLAGRNVLIVDADLRRPKLHEFLRLHNTCGLTDVLAGSVQADDVIHTVDVTAGPSASCRLSAVTSGRLSGGPFAAVQLPSLRGLIHDFARRYDVVLIDSPPALAVSDPLILASLVDGVLLTIKAGTSTASDAQRAKQRIEEAGGRILGVVMNCFNEALHGPAFHPYAGYYGKRRK